MLPKRRGSSVRTRLLLRVLAPPLLMLPLLISLVVYWGDAAYDRLLVHKVNAERITARQYVDRVLESQQRAVAGFAMSTRLRGAIDDDARLDAMLVEQARARHSDYLHLLDMSGRVVASLTRLDGVRQAGGQTPACTARPVVLSALADEGRVALAVFSAQQLDEVGPPLRECAWLAIVPTANA